MERQLAFALLIASLALSVATADPAPPVATRPDLHTAHGLFQACSDRQYGGFNKGYCFGFINGVADMMLWSRALLEKQGAALSSNSNYCPPPAITREELFQAFMIWHAQHPEHRDRYGLAVAGVMAALREKWPCPASQQNASQGRSNTGKR